MIPEPPYSHQRVSKIIGYNAQLSSLLIYDFILLVGRLYQVEYAMEAISHAGTCLGILAQDGILLAAERRNTNKLLDGAIFSEKIYKLNE